MSTNWITLSQTAGTGNQVVTVSAVTNEVMSERNLRIKITTGGKTEYVFVTQDAAPLMVTRIEFTGCQFPPISYTGGTLTTSDGRYNITAYYNDGSVVPQVAATVTGNSFSSSAINASLSVVSAGTMNLTASFSGKSVSTTYTVMQMGVPEGRYIEYSGNSQVNVSGNWSSTGATNVIANSYSGGSGLIVFDNVADYIPTEAFANQTGLTWVGLPSTIDEISSDVFSGCSSLTTIGYNGTMDEFESITKDSAWRDGSSIEYVQCTDGIIDLNYAEFVVHDLYFPYDGGSYAISISANTNWTLSASSNWFTFNPSSGFGDSTVTINCNLNLSENTFTGSLFIIKRGLINDTLNITQSELETPNDKEIKYSANAKLTESQSVYSGLRLNEIYFDNMQAIADIHNFNEYSKIGTIKSSHNGYPYFIRYSAFRNCTGMTSVIIPRYLNNIMVNQSSSVHMPDSFAGCWNLTTVYIDSNTIVSRIYDHSYDSNRGSRELFGNQVKNYIIGSNVTKIGDGMFCWLNDFSIYFLNSSLTDIDDYAFYGSKIASIIIPKTVTSIGSTAFNGCNNLTSLKIEEDNTVYDSRNNCNAVIETASNTLIVGCNNTVIPNNITEIGDYAFCELSGFTSIIIPNTVTNIGEYAFYRCNGLTSIVIPEGVTNIGESAFYNCSGLSAVNISNSVASIGQGAFHSCTNLVSLVIGSGVTSIERVAFCDCGSLTSITFNGTQGQWYSITKGEWWNLHSPISVIHCTDGDISV